MKQNSGIIPLFPLPIIIFPDERLPLHIFEPRYKLMIQRCLKLGQDARFGVSFVEEDRIADIGCTAAIDGIITEYSDGRYDISARGGERFCIKNILDRAEYLEAEVEYLSDPENERVEVQLRDRVFALHARFTELTSGRPVMHDYSHAAVVSFSLASDAGLPNQLRQQLLEMIGEGKRLAFLAQHFQKMNEEISSKHEVREKVGSNGFLKH